MKFKIKKEDYLDKKIFDRLYDEAYSKISFNRKKDLNLKQELWTNTKTKTLCVYYLDDYIVGIGTYIIRNNIMYFITPTWGKTKEGSHSWWYTEEYQEALSKFMKELGVTTIIAGHNIDSPAAKAIAKHFGYYGKHLSKATLHNPSDVMPIDLLKLYPEPMKAFKVEVKA